MAKVGRMVKELILTELTGELTERPSFVITQINRLKAAEANVLRQKLFGSNAKLVMIQRRLGLRAIEQLKVPGLADLFEGSIGLVLPGEDVLPVTKLIVDFIKAHEGQLSVRGAVVDGQLLDKARVEHLASLPPKPVLLAQVVATLEAPLTDVILTVEQLIGDVAWLAEQAATKKPAEEAAPKSADAAPAATPPSAHTDSPAGDAPPAAPTA